MEDFFIITNNPLVYKRLSGEYDIEYYETDFKGVLIKIRDHIYLGKKLLTHPLSGSIKPNETPYKSVLIERETTGTDEMSVKLIESAIGAADKFKFKPTKEDDAGLEDMQLIDYTLISGALASTGA